MSAAGVMAWVAAVTLAAGLVTAQGAQALQGPAPTTNPVPPQASASAGAEASNGASPRAVHTRLGAAQPRLGEPFDYEIEIRHPTAEAYTPPATVDLAPFDAEPLGCRRATVPGGW